MSDKIKSVPSISVTYARSGAAESSNARARRKAEIDRLQEQVAHLQEEVRIKDARMAHMSDGALSSCEVGRNRPRPSRPTHVTRPT